MSKVIKNREDWINENYYEASSTAVPGQGVGAGLFPGHSITEKDVPQQGANGVKQDPDYENLARMTHATYEGRPQLGDIVQDMNKDCPYYKTSGKLFSIIGTKGQYIIAEESDNHSRGEVAYVEMAHLKTLKTHQMNGGSAVYESESIDEASRWKGKEIYPNWVKPKDIGGFIKKESDLEVGSQYVLLDLGMNVWQAEYEYIGKVGPMHQFKVTDQFAGDTEPIEYSDEDLKDAIKDKEIASMNESVNEMKMVNKKTGEDVTKYVIQLLNKEITPEEFEKITGLKKK